MQPTRIIRVTPLIRAFFPTTPLGIAVSSSIGLYLNWELYRINRGTQPYLSSKLAAVGFQPMFPANTSESAAATEEQQKQSRIATIAGTRQLDTRRGEREEKKDEGKSDSQWMVLNGVPIPRFEILVRPFRKE